MPVAASLASEPTATSASVDSADSVPTGFAAPSAPVDYASLELADFATLPYASESSEILLPPDLGGASQRRLLRTFVRHPPLEACLDRSSVGGDSLATTGAGIGIFAAGRVVLAA